jgi:hypothetical protein
MQYVWIYPFLAFAWIFAFVFAFDHVLNNRGFSGRRFLLLIFCLIIASSVVTHAAWIVGTPKWSFMVSTDKSNYMQNETIQITVTLKNIGYIPHSFISITDPPLIVEVEGIWYTPIVDRNQTTITLSPGQNLTRTFTWNQTITYVQPPVPVRPGAYYLYAFVPDPNSYPSTLPYLPPFWSRTIVNITSTT